MTRRVLLHVGTPKSGTSYLQDRLACNRERAQQAGLCYVPTRTGDHFEAALDLLDDPWDGALERARGQWPALVERTRGVSEDVLVSHEILAGASPEAVARVHEAFPDDELHVVLTVRDLGRQVPAEWQENVKHRAPRPYASYLRRIERRLETPADDRFWRMQHLPTIVRTWSQGLDPERVHVVTVPPPGAPHGTLWQRYSEALGLGDTAGWTESHAVNASLGAAEVTLLRRLNVELHERGLPREEYVTWVRDGLVRQVLGADRGSPRATVPPRLRGWVEEVADAWITELGGSGVAVVGDLDDLRPVWPDDAATWTDPDDPDPETTIARAVDALAWAIESASRVSAPPGDTPATRAERLRRAVRTWRRG